MLKRILILSYFILTIDTIYANPENIPNSSPAQSSLYYELLDDLLVAELAAQRGHIYTALNNYKRIAKESADPKMAQIATEYSIKIQDERSATEMSELWAKLAPDNPQVQLVALTLTIGNKPEAALKFVDKVLELQADKFDQTILEIFFLLPDQGKQNLKTLLYYMARKHTINAYAQLAAAQVAAQLNEFQKSLNLVDISLKIKPDLTNAIELKAKLISQANNDDLPALKYLNKMVNQYPKNFALKLFYAKALIDNEQVDNAIAILKNLTEVAKNNGEALIVLSKIYLDKNELDKAQVYLLKAVELDESRSVARYLLGQIAEKKNDFSNAITLYSLIDDKEIGVVAKLRAALLLATEQKYDEALSLLHTANPETSLEQKQLLLTEINILIESKDLIQALKIANSVLKIIPNDSDFLYIRSFIYSLNDDFPEAEKDLKTILASDPENIDALNALNNIQPKKEVQNLPQRQKAN